LCSFQVRRNRIPSVCSDDPIMRPNTHQCLLFKLASVRTSQQHVRMLFRVLEESSVQVHPSGRRGKTSMGRLLQPFGRKVYTVWTLVLIMEIACNRSTTVPTRPYSEKNISAFEKPVAQLSIQTLSATAQTPPRENHSRLDLGLL
jgi:hypothetical protein